MLSIRQISQNLKRKLIDYSDRMLLTYHSQGPVLKKIDHEIACQERVSKIILETGGHLVGLP